MKKTLALVLAAGMALAGCAGSPIALSSASPAQLKNEPTLNIAAAYNHSPKKELLDELTSRKALNTLDISALRNNSGVSIGMSKVGMIASMGKWDKINRTVNASGSFDQYIYGTACAPYCKRAYVYLQNDIVTSWSN
jgi:hypothetical protein